MKVKQILPMLLALLALASCATKPAPVQPEPPAPVATVDTSKADAVKKLQEEVLALRKKAFDLEAPKYAEPEWKEADDHYTKGTSALETNDLDNAKSELETAKPLFTALIQLALQRGAEANQKLAADARDSAIGLKAKEKSPEIMAKADDLYSQAETAYNKGDFESAKALYDQAYLYYDIAGKRAKAVSVKERITQMGFESADGGNYKLAEEKLAAGDAEKDPVKARDYIEESLLRYNLVLQKGWELQAGTEKQNVLDIKAQADSIKAAVSMREDYSTALAILNAANDAMAKGEYEYAAMLYSQAQQLFAEVYKKAAEKRAQAEAAMKAAQERQQQSQTVIDNAGSTEGGN